MGQVKKSTSDGFHLVGRGLDEHRRHRVPGQAELSPEHPLSFAAGQRGLRSNRVVVETGHDDRVPDRALGCQFLGQTNLEAVADLEGEAFAQGRPEERPLLGNRQAPTLGIDHAA